ncbi:MAG: hypothetical protein HN704_09015 [Bacteroidetes bacterium]|jgi:hypothetical protein|nr:hypothetical protein [Bacteroidota bacterium]MBT6686136.1 hypothetical protein [Bacteroidota bacterium]MBT7144021.1 hypothetical protein [Bacteroidota bacterium]MBT7491732.1 hypothetical protein [Bacteroidota bacterium]
MKIRNISTLFIALFFFSSAFAQDSTLIKGKDWYIPDYAKVQFAGNIGFFSIGIGYQFFNNHLYSELLYGYVPVSISKAEQIHTITIKNTLPVFTKKFNNIALSPITGFTASFETGNNSFLKLLDKYPKDYYSTNAFHFTFFIGASIHKDFINSKIINGVDLYFELGTVDTYFWYAIISKEVKVNKIFSSAIGINLFF